VDVGGNGPQEARPQRATPRTKPMVCRDRSPRRTAGGRKRDPELYHSTGVGLRMDSNRFCTASFLGLDCDAHEESTEYGERRATPSESLQPSPAITSHHQPSPAITSQPNRQGPEQTCSSPLHLPNTHRPRSSLTYKTRARTTCPHEEKSPASVSIPLTLLSTVEDYS
jgi:hypothetical protein